MGEGYIPIVLSGIKELRNHSKIGSAHGITLDHFLSIRFFTFLYSSIPETPHISEKLKHSLMTQTSPSIYLYTDLGCEQSNQKPEAVIILSRETEPQVFRVSCSVLFQPTLWLVKERESIGEK